LSGELLSVCTECMTLADDADRAAREEREANKS